MGAIMVKNNSSSKARTTRKRVCFRFSEAVADSVSVAGDFNHWDQKCHCLKKKGNGMWEKTIFLAPGSYEYKFFVDGQWRMDPQNSCECVNLYGTRNNVLIVAQE
jgi:1,4-alpha-glucan branching enzyme